MRNFLILLTLLGVIFFIFKWKFGSTALHKAASSYSPVVAHFLINIGADVNAKDKNGETPLHHAIRYGRYDGPGLTGLTKALFGTLAVVKLLVNNEADLNAKDNDGDTPLHEAVIYGHFKKAQFLIKNGSNVNVQNNEGKTPLHAAVEKKDFQTVQLIIGNKADVHIENNEGLTALMLARQKGHLEIVGFLKKHYISD